MNWTGGYAASLRPPARRLGRLLRAGRAAPRPLGLRPPRGLNGRIAGPLPVASKEGGGVTVVGCLADGPLRQVTTPRPRGDRPGMGDIAALLRNRLGRHGPGREQVSGVGQARTGAEPQTQCSSRF